MVIFLAWSTKFLIMCVCVNEKWSVNLLEIRNAQSYVTFCQNNMNNDLSNQRIVAFIFIS